MPIPVECPGCGARLNAPDAGAGKKVRCPKPNCGELIPVPAALVAEEVEVVDASPAPPPRRPSRRDDEDDRPRRRRDEDEDERPRRRRDEDDDRTRGRRRDDEDDDRRPTRRRREEDEDDRPRRDRHPPPRRRRGLGTPAVVAIVIGSILALGGIGYGIYAMLGGSKTPLPPGWKEYTYQDDGFKAAFPTEPQVSRMGDVMGAMGAGKGGGGVGGFPGFDAGGMGSLNMYTSGGFNDAVHIEVTVYRFPSGVPRAFRDQMAQGIRNMPGVPGGLGVETKSVRWMGESATEIVTPGLVTRIAITDKAMYQAAIGGKGGRRTTPEEEKAFFDNFVPAR
jgi:hypothetical protein